MDPGHDPHALLLDALSTRHTSLGTDDVSWAFTTPKTRVPVEEWIERYLGPDTFLSYEEVEIFDNLQKTGVLKRIEKQHAEFSSHAPRSEESLRLETAELNEDTERLKKQTAVLKQQKTTLDAMRSRQRVERERKKKLEHQRGKKWSAEKEELQAAVDDLLSIMKEEVADLRQTVKDRETTKAEVEKMLGSDDRVLGRLERMAAGIVVPDQNGGRQVETVKRIELLVTKLTELSGLTVKTRLDRIFLDAYSKRKEEEIQGATSEMQELQAELDSLYSEIPTVIEMVASQKYLQPVHQEMEIDRRRRGENWGVGGEYIRQVLHHLQKRNDAASEVLRQSLSRDNAVLSLTATIDREAVTPLHRDNEDVQTNERPKTPPSRAIRRQSGSPVKLGSSPTKLRNIPYLTPAKRRGRSVDFGHDVNEYPELSMLSYLGISIPAYSTSITTPRTSDRFSPVKGASAVSPTPSVISEKFLREQLLQQRGKLATQSLAMDSTTRSLLGNGMDEVFVLNRRLNESLHGENAFPTTKKEAVEAGGASVLVREDIRDGVQEVEKEVEQVAGKLQRVVGAVELLEKSGGDTSGQGEKTDFVQRWTR